MENSSFISDILSFSHPIVSEILLGLSEHQKVDSEWFSSKQSDLTCKVLLRKYLLRYWEFYDQKPDSKLGKQFTRMKITGGFSHDQCLFDFLFEVIYEQTKRICVLLATSDNNSIQTSIPIFQTLINTPLSKALEKCSYGCTNTCTL